MTAVAGTVYLVGAGPGDPGLLTRRGEALLRSCTAVVHDRLGTEDLMELVPAGAARVDVGKQPGKKAASQEEIHEHLARLAREGHAVVRLKGGDPFVFGRGGEEALYLRERGLPFEVVPGVTSGIAAPAYAGIPVTHRAMAVGVTLFTAHEDPDKESSQLHLESLAQPGTTGVFYMGRRNLPELAARLMRLGRSASTPVALIEWGTYSRQRTVTGTLEDIASRADEAGLVPPCMTVVGEVVALREQLAWFDRRPLFGRTVAVTRARAQASELSARLGALGARVLEAPTIRIEAAEDPGPLQAAARRAGDYDWLVVTSSNAAERLLEAVAETGGDARRLAGVRLVAVGPSTAAALASRGLVADRVAEVFGAEGVLAAMEDGLEPGQRVLFPRAEEGRTLVSDALTARGLEVDLVTAYRTVAAEVPEQVLECFRRQEVDLVTFTSSSTAENFHQAIGRLAPRGYRVAAIGPTTARTATELGYPPDVTAVEATVPSLVEAALGVLATP